VSSYIVMGVIAAVITGLAIGAQSTLTSKVGTIVGSFRTGVLTNFIGGAMAGLIFIVILLANGKDFWRLPGTTFTLLAIAGALGIFIISGIAFSLQRIGVAAGLAAVILGQMVISVIADARGWGGSEPIPVTFPRILGMVIIIIGVYLILPKK
jgi:transporter family-2 protein